MIMIMIVTAIMIMMIIVIIVSDWPTRLALAIHGPGQL